MEPPEYTTQPGDLPEILVPIEVDPQVVIIQDIQDSPDDPTCCRFNFVSGDAEGFFDLPKEYADRLPAGTQLMVRSSNKPNQN